MFDSRPAGPVFDSGPAGLVINRGCEHGSILITTRSRSTALQLVEHGDIIDMRPMEEKHAIALLKKKLGGDANNTDLSALATR